MDLERRVKLLEQEVKLLKNQIQKTLLDIEEQILTHYYPELYPIIYEFGSTPSSPDHDALPSGGGIGGNEFEPLPDLDTFISNSAPIKTVKIEDEPIITRDEIFSKQNTQNKQNRANGHAPAATAPSAGQTKAPEKSSKSNDLATWISKCIDKVGIERTRQLVDMQAKAGTLSPEDQAMLSMLIDTQELMGDTDGFDSASLFLELNALLDK